MMHYFNHLLLVFGLNLWIVIHSLTHTAVHSSDSPFRLEIDVFVHMQLNGVVDGTEQRETEGSPAEDTV